MKYKLATLPRGTAKLPILNLGYDAITLKQGASLSITPQTPHSEINYGGCGVFAKLLYYNMRKYLGITLLTYSSL